MPTDTRSHDDYNVGWICALPLEMAAAKTMVDEFHPPLSQPPNDSNTYVLGRVGSHNVAIASLPSGVYGTTSAAIVAKQMLLTFQSIKFGLLVGIGGGVPTFSDIRLGDIVVSQPSGTLPGVVQYDYGKSLESGRFQRTGTMNLPPQELLTAISHIQSNRMTGKSELWSHISGIASDEMLSAFHSPGAETDDLFKPSYPHNMSYDDCSHCDRDQTVKRKPRQSSMPMIHYGTIASANQVMKSAEVRDRLARELGILCFEMEAAGLMDHFPCLVIRGICDYADSHKHKEWQGYAATTAAAYAKELLTEVPPKKLRKEKKSNSSRFHVRFNTIDIPQLSHFAGRDQELAEIHASLNSQTPNRIVVLHGLDGIGKTQLATKYVLQHQHDYCAIFWLDATSLSTMERSFVEMARRIMLDHDIENFQNFISIQKKSMNRSLSLSEAGKMTLSTLSSFIPNSMRDEGSSSSEIIEALKLWLSDPENPRWLLIYDNFIPENYPPFDHEDCQAIEKYLPYAHQGDVLVTTPAPKFKIGKSIHVQSMSSNDSVEILCSASGREDLDKDPHARTLVDEMGGIPLALAATGKYLRQVPITISEYLTLYKRKYLELQSQSPQAPEYENKLHTNFVIAFSKVSYQSLAASVILNKWAYLDSHDLWRELLMMRPSSEAGEIAIDPIFFHETMKLISDYGLIEPRSDRKGTGIHSGGYRMPNPLHSSLVHLVQSRGGFHEEQILLSVMLLKDYGDWLSEAEDTDEFFRWAPHAKRSWEIVSQNRQKFSNKHDCKWATTSVKMGLVLGAGDLWARSMGHILFLNMFGLEFERVVANHNLATQWLAFSREKAAGLENTDDFECAITSLLLTTHFLIGNHSELSRICELEINAYRNQNRPRTKRYRQLYWKCRMFLLLCRMKPYTDWYGYFFPPYVLSVNCMLCIWGILTQEDLVFVFGLYITSVPLIAFLLGRISWRKSAGLFISLVCLVEIFVWYRDNFMSWIRFLSYSWNLLPVFLLAYYEGLGPRHEKQ